MRSNASQGGSGAPLPAARAFVLQIAARTPGEPATLAGRVEHVVTGAARHFASTDELLAFVVATLRAVEARADPES